METNSYFEYFLKNEKNTVLMNNTWTIWNNRNFGEIECRKLFSKSQSGCRRPPISNVSMAPYICSYESI